MRSTIARLASKFDEQDADIVASDPLGFAGYADQLAEARSQSHAAEACVWGWAEIGGIECALVVMDFEFLGGSMGVAVGEKIARAFDAATDRKRPVVTVTASGGARMQEGMVALVQMAKTAEARSRHRGRGLAHVALLTSPTTGGVYASFASLADVVLAEPRATIAFAGPRVITELTGVAPEAGTQTAEFAAEHGLVDEIVPPGEQGSTVARVLRNVTGAPAARTSAPTVSERARPGGDHVSRTAFERLEIARRADRPKARFLLDALLDDAFELRGDRRGANDPTVVGRVGALPGGRRVLALGQDSSGAGRIAASGFWKAVRLVRLAGRFGLPVVSLIDTAGADPLPESEGRGLAAAIAWTFVAMLECPTPTLSVVVGEGGSGGGLAMTVADRVLAWENAVFSVIAPEAAASILYRDASRGPELAERLQITAPDLLRLGIVDAIVAEPPGGAHTDAVAAADDLAARVAAAVADLAATSDSERLAARGRRWRQAGNEWITRPSDHKPR